MRIIIILLSLSFILLSCERNYIKDLKIEGISLGDSLIDTYSKNEILANQWNYYVDLGFNSSSFFPKATTFEYEQIEAGYKIDDDKFIVHKISGVIFYENNIEQCYPKKKEIVKKLSESLKNTNWENDIFEDNLGKYDSEWILLEGGEYISVDCYDWKTETEKEKNWVDNLQVRITSSEWEVMLLSQ